jgi:hypothetical protein
MLIQAIRANRFAYCLLHVIKAGDTLSPLLFNFACEYGVANVHKNHAAE